VEEEEIAVEDKKEVDKDCFLVNMDPFSSNSSKYVFSIVRILVSLVIA
jgi:hypothetical protein